MVRFESEEEEEKKNGKIFFARAKRHKIYCKTVFDFFSLSLVLVLSGRRRRRRVPPPRERERERGARISSKTLLVSRFAKHTCVCSLSVLSLFL